MDFPFLLAAAMAAGAVWQFGFSSTAAPQMATPGHFLEAPVGVMSLRTTISILWFPLGVATLTLVR